MLRNVCVAVTAIALCSTSATAQPADSDIVVVGERLEQVTRDYVTAVSAPSVRENQLARWDERVCVGVTGLSASDGQMIVDRISARAAAVGLRTGEPGCRANVMVIFAPDSDAVAQNIVRERRELLGYYTDDAVSTTGGREGLEAFANTPRPIRWWHVARNVTADGRALVTTQTAPAATGAESRAANTAAANGQPSTGVGSFSGIQTTRSNGTRMRRETRQDLEYVLIIVDARRVAEFPVEAWVDYVAMVSLAQVNPDASPSSVPSVLNLFTSAVENTPMAMTDWDVAYLDGLYAATREATNTGQQQREIGRRIVATMTVDRPN